MQQRNGFLTGLEGSPAILSSNLGKIRLYTGGPATDGVQGIVPGEVVLAEVVNRAVKRLVLNDFTQFFINSRKFRVEKHGDNRYSYFSYDVQEAGSTQVQPVQVGFLKPFSSLVDSNGTVGAINTFAALATYLPNSAKLWGTGTTNRSLDGNFGANASCNSFKIEVGVSAKEDPFVEGIIDDAAFVNSNLFGTSALPRLTIAGQGCQATFISNLSTVLSKGLQLELKDMNILGTMAISIATAGGELHLNNVRMDGATFTSPTASRMFGSAYIGGAKYEFNGESYTKMTPPGATNFGMGYYQFDKSKSLFQEIAFWGNSTASDAATGYEAQ